MPMSTCPCDFGHRRLALLPSSSGGMVQRSIAAVVLATLCWLSVPVAFGSFETVAVHRVQHDASPAHDQSCCPGSHPRISPAQFLAINSPAMPCGEQHPCCARQAPSNPSTMPVETKVVRHAAERVLALVMNRPSTGAAESRHRPSVSFRRPSNEALSCGSEFCFSCA